MIARDALVRPASSGPDRASRRSLLRPAGVAVLAVVAAVVVRTIDPNQPGHYPLCPFHAVTGWDCPGCGSTRGMHDLLNGDVVGALDHNVLLALAVPVAVLAWLGWVRRAWTGRPPRLVVPVPAIVGLILVVLVFWVVRNVPGVPWLGAT